MGTKRLSKEEMLEAYGECELTFRRAGGGQVYFISAPQEGMTVEFTFEPDFYSFSYEPGNNGTLISIIEDQGEYPCEVEVYRDGEFIEYYSC